MLMDGVPVIARFLVNSIPRSRNERTKSTELHTNRLIPWTGTECPLRKWGPGWERSSWTHLEKGKRSAEPTGGRRTARITFVLVSSIRPTCGDHRARTRQNHSAPVRRSPTSWRMRRVTRTLRTARTWPSNAPGRLEGIADQRRSEAKPLRLSRAFR